MMEVRFSCSLEKVKNDVVGTFGVIIQLHDILKEMGFRFGSIGVTGKTFNVRWVFDKISNTREI